MRGDDLHDRLTGLATGAGLALPDSHEVQTRGDRRRTRVSIVAAGVSIVAVAAVVAGSLSVRMSAASLPVGVGEPSSTPSASATTYIVRPPGPHAPSGSAAPSSSPPRTPARASTQPAAVTKIPASLRMLHQGDAGWTTNDNPDVPGVFNPCGGVDVTAAGRTDARTLRGPGMPGEESHSPSKTTHQLFLFATDQAAATAFTQLSAGGCGWTKTVMNPGDATSTHWARLSKAEPYTQQPGVYWLHGAVLVRTGNALLIVYADTSGAGMTSNLADQEIDNILRPLCHAELVCR